jgi:hypothetical protein
MTPHTCSRTFISRRPNPLASTITSNRKPSSLPLSPSPTVLLNLGYIALSYLNRLRKNVRIHSTSLLKYLKRSGHLIVVGSTRVTDSPLSILVRGANHLREINHDRFAVLAANEDVEFVEVTVYESRTRKPDDEVHQLRVEFTRRRHLVDLTPLRPCPVSGEHALIETEFSTHRG